MNKIRFGIVGTGTIAHRFANAIKNVPEAELSAVASRSQSTAEKFGDEFEIENRFGSYEAMAKSDKIDAAYIAVPHSGHAENAILMMNNGKAVISEKPMAVNEREASEMFKCGAENNVFIMEAMWARLVPGTIKMLEIVNSGILGDIRGVSGQFCYNMDDEPDHHAFKVANGGGSLLDVGIYGLNFSKWYLGEDVTDIKALADLKDGVDINMSALLKYKSGAIAEISSAMLLNKPNEGYIYGTKGYAYLKRFYAPEEIVLHIDGKSDEIIKTPYRGNGFEEQIRHMCDCIAEGRTLSPVNTPENTLYIARQMDEIRKLIGVKYPQDER